MARILVREPLTDKDMAKMASTCLAGNLGAISVRIGCFFDGSRNLVIETRPATVAAELVF